MYLLRSSIALMMVGTLAAFLNTPFHAAIVYSDTWSSGALISRLHILTTAKAVKSLEQGVVILGTYALNDTEGRQQFEITKSNVILHEKFDENKHINNIALVNLPFAPLETKSCQIINFPDRKDQGNFFEGENIIIHFYGQYRAGAVIGDRMSRSLIYDSDLCTDEFGVTKDQAFCAEREFTKDKCEFDEGAVVVLEKSQKFVGLITIVDDCRFSYRPYLATRVAQFSGWINEKMRLDGRILW